MFSSIRKQRAVAEVERRKNRRSTFTEPIHCSASEDPVEFDQLKQFLTQFYRTIYQRQAEIKTILQEEANVAGHYQQLVGTTKQVSMEEFWQRYFYRCNVERVLQQWERRDSSARQARVEAISGGLSSVSKLARSWSEKTVKEAATSSSNLGNSSSNENSPKSNASTASTSSTNQGGDKSISPTASTTETEETVDKETSTKKNSNDTTGIEVLQTDTAPTTDSDIINGNSTTLESSAAATGTEEKAFQPAQGERVELEDEAKNTSTTVATTTTPATKQLTSRMLNLLQDDDDDDIDNSVNAPNVNPTTTTTITVPSSATHGFTSNVNVANDPKGGDAEPMLAKLTPTKLMNLSTTNAAMNSTSERAQASPSSSPNHTMFREWNRGTSQQEQADQPTLDDNDGSYSCRLRDKVSQLQSLETSLDTKALFRSPAENSEKKEKPTTTEHQEQQQQVPCRLDYGVAKETNVMTPTTTPSKVVVVESNNHDKDNIDQQDNNKDMTKENVAPTAEASTATASTPTDKNETLVEDSNHTSPERSNSEVTPDEKLARSDDTNEASVGAVAMTSFTPTKEQQSLSVKTDEEKKEEDSTIVAEASTTKTSNAFHDPVEDNNNVAESTPVKEEIEELKETPVLSAPTDTSLVHVPLALVATNNESEESVHDQKQKEGSTSVPIVKMDEPQQNLKTADESSNVVDREHSTSVEVAVMETKAQGEKEEQINQKEEESTNVASSATAESVPQGIVKIEAYASPSSKSLVKPDASFMTPTELPPIDLEYDSNATNGTHLHETNHDGSRQTPTSHSSSSGVSTTRSRRPWYLSLLIISLVVGVAVMSKVAQVWMTTTPDGIQFVDSFCAPVQPGTKLPLESDSGAEAGTPSASLQTFEAPWWAPPQYKELAFDLVCTAATAINGTSRKRIRLDWTTPVTKQKQQQLHRLVISSLVKVDGLAEEEILYDAWLKSAVVETAEIMTLDKRGKHGVVTNLWTVA